MARLDLRSSFGALGWYCMTDQGTNQALKLDCDRETRRCDQS